MSHLVVKIETSGLDPVEDKVIQLTVLNMDKQILVYQNFGTYRQVDVRYCGVTNEFLNRFRFFTYLDFDWGDLLEDETLVMYNEPWEMSFLLLNETFRGYDGTVCIMDKLTEVMGRRVRMPFSSLEHTANLSLNKAESLVDLCNNYSFVGEKSKEVLSLDF
jgi:hypothetical protein